MGTRVSGKALLSFVLVAIIIASVTTSMMCSISAYSVGGPYNIIEKQPSVQTVLLGQDLEFSNTDWTAPPIVNRYVSGYLETTYTATEKNGRYYIDTTNWRASGTFYVNGEPGGYEAQLSAEEPDMPLKLKVMGGDVSSLARGTMLTVDVGGINLNDEDRVDLAIIGPEGPITEKNTQQFKGITVSKLKDLIIDTTGWDAGYYTFQVKSQPDNACGLDAQSVKRELTILKSEVRIKADTTEVPELENVKLTVMGVPGHSIEIKSDPFSTNAYFPSGLDDNPMDKTTFTLNDIIDDDGVRRYVVEFKDPGLYTIRVTDLDESDSYDSVDILITEKLEPTPEPTPATRSTTPSKGGILSPDTLIATLNPGESVTETKTYTTAEGKPITKVDVLFVFDLTGSMGEELSIMQTESQNIMNSLLESVPDSAFGVASFMDYSCYDALSSDYPWKLNKWITTNTNAVRDAINGLVVVDGSGGDVPEAYTRALYESYADSGVNWRTGAKKIVLMFGDAVPHEIDPGRDGKVGTADDLDFEEVVAELKSQGITVLALHSGTDDIPWKHLADETGGHYYKLGHAEASKIPEAITSMLVAEVETIGELTLRAEPDYESWISFTPNKYTNVGAKTTKTFTVKVTAPAGTKGGTDKFNIDVLGDGTVLDTQEVTITTVREQTPSPSPSPTPTPTRKPVRERTPKPTAVVTPTPTRISTPTPTRTTPIPSPTTSFEPAISVLPTSHNFGRMYVTGTSSPMMFTITNTGSEDLTIGPLSIRGVADDEFRIWENNCRGRAIAQSRSCTVNVLFAPRSEGEKSASLRILSNDPDTPTLNVPLQGTAVISEQESQLRNCNVAIKENGDTIISFLYDLSPAEEAAWLAGRFEIARTIENELRRIYKEDAAIITISAIETTVIVPNLIEPTDKTYTMPELNLQDIERRYQNSTISLIPTTVTIEFPDKYTETFVETDIVPETTHTISGVINPWILICSPPSGAKLRNATTINVWSSDDIQRVSLLITGVGGEKRWEPDSDPPFCFEWDPNDTNVSGGSYQIKATGFVDDEGDVPVTYSIIVDVEKPMVPPATLFGVLIVFITAGVVAAGAAASSLRTTTEMRGRNGTGKWDMKLSLNQSILYGKYRTTIIGDILRVILSIGILSFACTLQNELPKRTVATFSIPFHKEVPFLVPTLEGFGPNALSTFFSILFLVGFILLAREFVQHFLAWVLDAEVGAVMDKTDTVVLLGSGLFGLAVGKPLRPIIWDDLSSRVKGVICLGNILCLFSLFAFFYYAVSGRPSDNSWMPLVKNVAIPAVAMLLMTSLIPFGGREGTAIFEWNKPLAISLFVISGLLYISLIRHWIDPLTLPYSIGMVALAGSVVLIGGVLFYKFMEWINLV